MKDEKAERILANMAQEILQEATKGLGDHRSWAIVAQCATNIIRVLDPDFERIPEKKG